jgi:hypothetical protein
MKQVIKKYILIALLGCAGYFILSHHLIFYGKQIHLLDKDSLHLTYTFVSLNQVKPEVVLRIEMLREDGIGDLMVDLGIITREKLWQLEQKIDTGG